MAPRIDGPLSLRNKSDDRDIFTKIFLALHAELIESTDRPALMRERAKDPEIQDNAEIVLEYLEQADHKLAPMWVRAAVKSCMKVALMEKRDRIVREKAAGKAAYDQDDKFGMF